MKVNPILKNPDYSLIALVIIVNLIGLTNMLTIDTALYASISKIMAETNNYIELFTINRGDWLDKPHFPFWVWAASIKLFGANTFAIKFPALLFFFMSIIYTYLFTKEWYDKRTALSAVLILSTALHIIISNNDVRAETFLIGMLIGAVYHFSRFYKSPKLHHFLLGCLITAAAILTKGIFLLIPIVSAIAGHAIMKNELRELFKIKWLFCALFIAVLLLPELYCLKVQFTDHPEKIVFGQRNISPFRFFFWDSQFGRFLNTGPIKGSGNPFFFFYNMLWTFFPWILFLYLGATRIFKGSKEYYTFFAAVMMLLVFSLSQFQLSHYTNIIFPFLSILVANLLYTSDVLKQWSRLKNAPYYLGGFVAFVSILFCIFFRPDEWLYLLPITLLSAFVLWKIKRNAYELRKSLVYHFSVIMIFIGLFLNLIFYPSLFSYQSGFQAAKYLNENYKGSYTAAYGIDPHLFHYYLDTELNMEPSLYELLKASDSEMLLLTTKEYVDELEGQGVEFEIVKVFNYFHVTKLTLDFINYNTREAVLDKHYLVHTHRCDQLF